MCPLSSVNIDIGQGYVCGRLGDLRKLGAWKVEKEADVSRAA